MPHILQTAEQKQAEFAVSQGTARTHSAAIHPCQPRRLPESKRMRADMMPPSTKVALVSIAWGPETLIVLNGATTVR